MQINIALNENNKQQAEQLRAVRYPNTTAKQTRDSFIFNQCIDEFDASPEVLVEYVKTDEAEQKPKEQRMLTIKNESNTRLKTIAAALNASIAATYRSIIAYSIDQYELAQRGVTEKPKVLVKTDMISQQIIEKLALLESQTQSCQETIKEIRILLGK